MKTIILFTFLVFTACNPTTTPTKKTTITTTQRQILVSIDDLPFGYSGGISEADKIQALENILNALNRHKVPAIGFITTGNITPKTEGMLDKFVAAGYDMGNHTVTHPDLNSMSALEYLNEISVCDSVAAKWITTPKYFRYTMLHRGNTQSKKDSVAIFLKNKNYEVVPVSIDNDEWIYNRDFTNAYIKGETKKMDRIGKEYVEHMKERTLYFEALAQKVVKRPIRHVLLIHGNLINGYYLQELLDWYALEGWQFIDTKTAMKDELYQDDGDYVGRRGISQLERIEMSAKEKKE